MNRWILLGAAMIGVTCWLAAGMADQTSELREATPIAWKSTSSLAVDRVETREIVLRDAQGRQRAYLGVDSGDVVRFTASSGAQDGTFMLSVFPDGRAALILHDHRGVNRVAISVADDGRPVVTLGEDANVIFHDDKGRNRVVLGAPTEGEPHLTLYDRNMRATIVQAGVTPYAK